MNKKKILMWTIDGLVQLMSIVLFFSGGWLLTVQPEITTPLDPLGTGIFFLFVSFIMRPYSQYKSYFDTMQKFTKRQDEILEKLENLEVKEND